MTCPSPPSVLVRVVRLTAAWRRVRACAFVRVYRGRFPPPVCVFGLLRPSLCPALCPGQPVRAAASQMSLAPSLCAPPSPCLPGACLAPASRARRLGPAVRFCRTVKRQRPGRHVLRRVRAPRRVRACVCVCVCGRTGEVAGRCWTARPAWCGAIACRRPRWRRAAALVRARPKGRASLSCLLCTCALCARRCVRACAGAAAVFAVCAWGAARSSAGRGETACRGKGRGAWPLHMQPRNDTGGGRPPQANSSFSEHSGCCCCCVAWRLRGRQRRAVSHAVGTGRCSPFALRYCGREEGVGFWGWATGKGRLLHSPLASLLCSLLLSANKLHLRELDLAILVVRSSSCLPACLPDPSGLQEVYV